MKSTKRSDAVSYSRYKMHQYTIGLRLSSGNEQLAREYAEACLIALISGKEIFRRAYAEIKPILNQVYIPPDLRVFYSCFSNEFVSKVLIRKIASRDEIIDKWTSLGLSFDVLTSCVEILEREIPELEEKIAREGPPMGMFPFMGVTVKKEALEPHKETHEDDGDDEIDVTGLIGLLGDRQTPLWNDPVNSDIIPDEDNLRQLGVSGKSWKGLHLSYDGIYTPHTYPARIYAYFGGLRFLPREAGGDRQFSFFIDYAGSSGKGIVSIAHSRFGGGIWINPEVATITHQLKDSGQIRLSVNYWNGAKSTRLDSIIFHNITATTPTSQLDFQVPIGATKLSIKDTGELDVFGDVIPDADGTRDLGGFGKRFKYLYAWRVRPTTAYWAIELDTQNEEAYMTLMRRLNADATYQRLDVGLILTGKYWTGAASADRAAYIEHNIVDSTPTSQLDFEIPKGTSIFTMYDTGDAWMLGKLTQAGCPDFSELGITPMEYIEESLQKEYHETQSEVMALMNVVKSQQDKIDELEQRLNKLEKLVA